MSAEDCFDFNLSRLLIECDNKKSETRRMPWNVLCFLTKMGAQNCEILSIPPCPAFWSDKRKKLAEPGPEPGVVLVKQTKEYKEKKVKKHSKERPNQEARRRHSVGAPVLIKNAASDKPSKKHSKQRKTSKDQQSGKQRKDRQQKDSSGKKQPRDKKIGSVTQTMLLLPLLAQTVRFSHTH
ncbi:unnamed protein product [Angiostrongylus costaricensis]|uniref:40S ribosomal protein S6 n=1 Tax=Angiostrongylus costaricensis TaxID=334426 RepID=A0A0R3PPZ2_ANGCS|nr:unnamed protein product [Angiostrongylus costaricensis]